MAFGPNQVDKNNLTLGYILLYNINRIDKIALAEMDQTKPTKFGVAGSNPVEGSTFGDTTKQKLKKIKRTICLAEDWADRQILPESVICMAALKDIRTTVKKRGKKIYE